MFSSIWAALVAPALMLASGSALGVAVPTSALAFGFCGVLVVYGVDRLRDLDRDRSTSPARSAFVARHRARLVTLYGAAALVGAGAALALPRPAWALAAVAGGLGLLHRRLKHVPLLKTGYVTLAWVVVTVGIPACTHPSATARAGSGSLAAVALVVGAAIAANLVVSNLRDGESGAAFVGPQTALRVALGCCAAAGLLALAADEAGLAAIPAVQAAAIVGLARGPADPERYGLLQIDGALTAGAVLSLVPSWIA